MAKAVKVDKSSLNICILNDNKLTALPDHGKKDKTRVVSKNYITENSAVELIIEKLIEQINKRFAVIDYKVIKDTISLYEMNNDVNLSKSRPYITEKILKNYNIVCPK